MTDRDLEIQEEVAGEVSKYGKVLHCFVDKLSMGHVYLSFESVEAGQAAAAALHGRWFSQKRIAVEYVPREEYFARFPGVAERARE